MPDKQYGINLPSTNFNFASPAIFNGNYTTQKRPSSIVTWGEMASGVGNNENSAQLFQDMLKAHNKNPNDFKLIQGENGPVIQRLMTDADGNQVWNNVSMDSTFSGDNGKEINWGNIAGDVYNGLGAVTQLANSGLQMWSNFENYGTQKALLKAQKEQAELKNEQLRADMADMKAERERRDRIRNTAVKQRASSSSVTSW